MHFSSGEAFPLVTNASISAIRRAVLRTITTIVALATSAMLAGCGTSTTPTPGATATGVNPSARPTPDATLGAVAPSTLIMVIRHGEKPDGSHLGVDANGNADDSSLTAIGWNRAHRLVDLLDPAQGPPRPGLARPTAIYAAGATTTAKVRGPARPSNRSPTTSASP